MNLRPGLLQRPGPCLTLLQLRLFRAAAAPSAPSKPLELLPQPPPEADPLGLRLPSATVRVPRYSSCLSQAHAAPPLSRAAAACNAQTSESSRYSSPGLKLIPQPPPALRAAPVLCISRVLRSHCPEPLLRAPLAACDSTQHPTASCAATAASVPRCPAAAVTSIQQCQPSPCAAVPPSASGLCPCPAPGSSHSPHLALLPQPLPCVQVAPHNRCHAPAVPAAAGCSCIVFPRGYCTRPATVPSCCFLHRPNQRIKLLLQPRPEADPAASPSTPRCSCAVYLTRPSQPLS